MSLLKRQDTAFYIASDGDVRPLASGKVTAYDTGAIANGTNTDTTIPVYAGHGFTAGDCLMVNEDETKFRLVTVAASTQLTVNANVVTAEGDILVNLGTDTAGGSGTPNYDGSTVLIYSVPDTGTPITSPAKSQVATDSDGNYGYYHPSDVSIWELIRDSSGVPQSVVLLDSAVLLSPTGTPFVDNAIARWSGTAGLLIKSAYTSNTPTISDAGGITAAGIHTLGQTGNSVTIGGAIIVNQTASVTGNASVGGTLGVTGAISAPAANAFGTTGNTQAVAGALTVGQTLGVTGLTTLAGTTTGNLSTSAGTGPSGVVINSGWGAGATAVVTAGKDNRFTITVTSGTGTTTNAQFTVTFGTAFVAAPFGLVVLNVASGGAGAGVGLNWSTTVSTIVVTYRAVPAISTAYVFSFIVLG